MKNKTKMFLLVSWLCLQVHVCVLGVEWTPPVTIPGAFGFPQVAVSADCGCAICVWQDSGQIKSSSSPDGGQSWSSSPVPIPGASGFSPQVAVSADCNCVVCVWNDEVNVFKSPIRSNFSVDGGVNWEGVETVTEDPSRAPGVAVSANCNCVICVWEDEDGTVKSSTLLISPTLSNLTACKKLHRFPRQADLIHVLSWDVVEDAVKYRVYIDTGLTTFTTTPPGVLIAEIPARKKPFVEIHSRCPGKKVTYYVAPVDENGDNGISASITV